MSTYVIGFRPPDQRWKEMKAAWDACKAAGIDPPKTVEDFFDGEEPDPAGVVVEIESSACVKEWNDDGGRGFEVDVRKLPKDVYIVRFFNSW